MHAATVVFRLFTNHILQLFLTHRIYRLDVYSTCNRQKHAILNHLDLMTDNVFSVKLCIQYLVWLTGVICWLFLISLCIAVSQLNTAEYIQYVFISAWHICCVATELHFNDSAKTHFLASFRSLLVFAGHCDCVRCQQTVCLKLLFSWFSSGVFPSVLSMTVYRRQVWLSEIGE